MLNKAILIGHVGQDPEIRQANGEDFAVFSIATTEKWKDKEGNKKEKTEWHRVTCFTKGLVSVIKNYVKKGSKLYIEGQISTRKWTDDGGTERSITEINIHPFKGKLVLLDKSERADNPPDEAYESEREYEA